MIWVMGELFVGPAVKGEIVTDWPITVNKAVRVMSC